MQNVVLRRSVAALALIATVVFSTGMARASDDATRNAHARKDCVRGKFKDYYRQGEGGDPAPDYKGPVFKLSQDYPDTLAPMEDYPWLKIAFKDGGPVDPRAYLQAMLDYGLEGNVGVDFRVQNNKLRKWYGMPWMDWNTEVVGDWPGTDGREFVHGMTHEFDSSGQTLSDLQGDFADTWSSAYLNERAGFGIGQVYCDPDDPNPAALNPDRNGLNNMANGSYIIKLLFSTVTEDELHLVKGALEWDAHVFTNDDPTWRNKGPIARFDRKLGKVRLIQIDVSVRDDRSITGWLMGTFAYDGNNDGATPFDRMTPLGLQWGNDPKLTYSELCGSGTCDHSKLTEQWINEDAVKSLATPPLNFNHLGYGGRLAGPVDNSKASCMGCHQTAGFPAAAALPDFSANGAVVLKLDSAGSPQTNQDFRMTFFGNVPSGVVFNDQQLSSSDYSLQLSMSLQNFASLRCRGKAPKPSICAKLTAWGTAQKNWIDEALVFGMPGPNGGPVQPGAAQ